MVVVVVVPDVVSISVYSGNGGVDGVEVSDGTQDVGVGGGWYWR